MTKIWIAVAAALVVAAGIAAAFLLAPGNAPVTPPAPVASQTGPTATQPATEAAAVQPGDHILGQADAPVTIIEYASLTCPHCAQFHTETLPRLKSDYIDTGKVRLVFRDFPLDELALRAAALAECAPPDRYFGLLNVLFQGQSTWGTAADPNAALTRIGKVGGLTEEEVAACLAPESKVMDAVVEERFAGESAFSIRSTPSFIIAGKKYNGALTFEQLQDILTPLLP